MGDENPIRTLGDYSKPSHEGYKNTIKLPAANNVVPLRFDTVRLVQNGCSFHGIRSKDPNQHLKDFLKLVDSLNFDGENRERTCLLPHHGIDLWLQVQIFYDRIDKDLKKTVDYAAEGRLRKLSAEEACATIEKLAEYEDEGWNDPVDPEEGSLNHENPNIKKLLRIMEHKGNALMYDAISLMGRSESVTRRLKEKIIEEDSRMRKIEKITRYPEKEDPKPFRNLKFLETLTKSNSFHAPDFIPPKSLCVKHVGTIFPSPPLIRESTFGFKPVLPSIEEYTPPVTYPEEVEETLGILMEVEPLDEPPQEDLGLNTYNHDSPLISREIPSFDEPEPQLSPNLSPLDVNLGDKRGTDPLIKPHSPDSFRIKVVDPLTILTPPSSYASSFHPKEICCYYHLCLDDPKRHYGFKPGLLGRSGSLCVNFSKFEIMEDD
ncbi:hypothetical protein Tco_1455312 [Tanacetum coccineum]